MDSRNFAGDLSTGIRADVFVYGRDISRRAIISILWSKGIGEREKERIRSLRRTIKRLELEIKESMLYVYLLFNNLF